MQGSILVGPLVFEVYVGTRTLAVDAGCVGSRPRMREVGFVSRILERIVGDPSSGPNHLVRFLLDGGALLRDASVCPRALDTKALVCLLACLAVGLGASVITLHSL